MKKLTRLFLALAMAGALLCGAAMAAEDGSITVQLDGRTLTFTDAQPQMKDSRTFLPFRALFEELGAEVLYDQETCVVTAIRGDRTITMTLGSNELTITEGEKSSTVTMDVVPYVDVETWRTYVPVRFAAQALDCVVDWEQETYTVSIMTDPEALIAQMMEGKSFTYMEKLAQFLDESQEGEEQGLWIASAEGIMTLGGVIEIPLDATLLCDPSGTICFTLSDEILAAVGIEANTWFKLNLSDIGDEYAALTGEASTTEGLGSAISTLGVARLEEIITALSDDSFEVGEDALTTTWEMDPVYFGLELTLEDEEIACVTVMVYYADKMEVLLTLSMDGTGAVAGGVGMDDGKGTTLELSFTGESIETDGVTIRLDGATILDLSDPEVSNALMGVMPLGDAA